jgi:oligopeptidase B
MSIQPNMTNAGLIAPKVDVKPKHIVTHNHTRIDNYYWLNDPENPDVIAYLNAENEYLDKIMSPIKPLQEKLFEEMKGRIKEQDESVPVKDGAYFYYVKYVEGGEYPIYCRKKESSMKHNV